MPVRIMSEYVLTKRKEKMKFFLVKCKSSLLIPDGLPEETETSNKLSPLQVSWKQPLCACIRKRSCRGYTNMTPLSVCLSRSLSLSLSVWYSHSSIYTVCSTMTQEMILSSFGLLHYVFVLPISYILVK